jgi:AraC-like DNA-binding protein
MLNADCLAFANHPIETRRRHETSFLWEGCVFFPTANDAVENFPSCSFAKANNFPISSFAKANKFPISSFAKANKFTRLGFAPSVAGRDQLVLASCGSGTVRCNDVEITLHAGQAYFLPGQGDPSDSCQVYFDANLIRLDADTRVWLALSQWIRTVTRQPFSFLPGVWSNSQALIQSLERDFFVARDVRAAEKTKHLGTGRAHTPSENRASDRRPSENIHVFLPRETATAFKTSLNHRLEHAAHLPGRTLQKRLQVLSRMYRVLSHMERYCNDDLDIAALADIANYSKWHFLRTFQLTFGASPHQWLVQRRMHMARRALENSDLGITEIATLVGFEDRSAFSRAFKRAQGQTAQSYMLHARANFAVDTLAK